MIAIGDVVSRVLAFLGITKARVKAVVGGDCGCERRQQNWNAWGFAWQRRLLERYYAARIWLSSRLRWRWPGQLRWRLAMAWQFAGMAVRVLLFGRP